MVTLPKVGHEFAPASGRLPQYTAAYLSLTTQNSNHPCGAAARESARSSRHRDSGQSPATRSMSATPTAPDGSAAKPAAAYRRLSSQLCACRFPICFAIFMSGDGGLGGARSRRRRRARRPGHPRRRLGFAALLLDRPVAAGSGRGHRPHDPLLPGSFRQAASTADRLFAGRQMYCRSPSIVLPEATRANGGIDRRDGHVRTRPVRVSPGQLGLRRQLRTRDLPEIDRLGGSAVLCIYGEDEKDSLCPKLDPQKFKVGEAQGRSSFRRRLCRVGAGGSLPPRHLESPADTRRRRNPRRS